MDTGVEKPQSQTNYKRLQAVQNIYSRSKGSNFRQEQPNSAQIEPNNADFNQDALAEEIKRGQDLLRELRSKETQLASHIRQSRKPNSRLPAFDVNQLIEQQTQAEVQQVLNSSNAQANYNSLNSSQNMTFLRDIPLSENNSKREIRLKTSPLRENQSVLKSPLNQLQTRNFTSEQSQVSYSQQLRLIEKLRGDNSTLTNRLQLVVSELERVLADKERAQNMLTDVQNQTQECELEIQSIQNEDVSLIQGQQALLAQRQVNKDLRKSISDSDKTRVTTLRKLRSQQNERERSLNDLEDLQADLRHRTAILKEIQENKNLLEQQVQIVQQEIQEFQDKLESNDQHQNQNQRVIELLLVERDSLMKRLEELASTYEKIVCELNWERQNMESHQKEQLRLLAAKSMFNIIQQIADAKQQQALNEFISYCRFDEQCHKTLRQFAVILERIGFQKQSYAIKLWYQNIFDPLQVRNQTAYQFNQSESIQLKLVTFQKWRSAFSTSMEKRQQKRRSLILLIEFCIKQENKDKVRAVQAWKDKTKVVQQQLRLLKQVLRRRDSNLLRQSLQMWVYYSNEVQVIVKQHVLACQLSEKQQKTIVMASFKTAVQIQKDKRINRLLFCVKQWKNWMSRKKYMRLQAQKLALFKLELEQKLLAACFQQLRIDKELSKVDLMEETWTQRIQPQIEQLTEDISYLSTHELKTNKIRCLRSLSDASRRFLSSYFEHWKGVNQAVNQKLTRNLRTMILRKYRNTLQQALSKLREGKQFQVIHGQHITVSEQQMNQKQLCQHLSALTQKVNDEHSRSSYQKRTMLTHIIGIFNTRLSRFGLTRWRQRCRSLSDFQNAVLVLSERLKKSMKRSCWNQYKNFINKSRQQDKHNALIQKRLMLRQWKTKQIIFNAICQYFKHFQDQKTYWKITLTNLEVNLKRKGFRRWIEQSNLKKQHLFQKSQNLSTITFDEMNSILGQASVQLQIQTDENQQITQQMKTQAQRVLSNHYARSYYTKIGYGFRKWSEVTKFLIHREQIVKRTMQHKIKHQLLILRAAWANWISKTRILETENTIKYTQMKNEETLQLIGYQQQQHETQATRIQQQISIQEQSLLLKRNRMTLAVQIVTNQAQNNVYQSQLRFIFKRWVLYYKMYKNFAAVIQKVVSKSIWQNGFDQIRREYQANLRNDLKRTHLTAMLRLYWFKNTSKVVQAWKSRIMQIENSTLSSSIQQINHEAQKHDQHLSQILENNIDSLHKRKTFKLLYQTVKAWYTVLKFNKSVSQSTERFLEASRIAAQRKSLLLWLHRQKVTNQARNKINKFLKRRRIIYTSCVIRELRKRCQTKKNLCFKLSLLGKNYDRRNVLRAFEKITYFYQLRRGSQFVLRNNGAQNICQLILKTYIKRLRVNLTKFQRWFEFQKHRDAKLKSLIGTSLSKTKRKVFTRWRDNTNYLSTVEDVNLHGPIVEEVLDSRISHANHQSFMRSQGYTPLQIQQICEFAQDRQLCLINRSVARMKHFNEQGYLKPKVFDRWRSYVQIKKLVRYLLSNIENRLLPVKSDLSLAFNRWKYWVGNQNKSLSGIDRQILIDRCCQNNEKLRSQDLTGQKKEFQLVQLNFERDELIDNYVRAQKLALSAGRDNIERALAKTIGVLSDNNQNRKKAQLDQVLQRNIELIAGLKDRIMHLEFENNNLATDNEELRQFSLDGFEIAKNAQLLSTEREKLSVDLADKAKTIKKLLDEHEQLERSLREQQYKAEVLIQQTLNQRQN